MEGWDWGEKCDGMGLRGKCEELELWWKTSWNRIKRKNVKGLDWDEECEGLGLWQKKCEGF